MRSLPVLLAFCPFVVIAQSTMERMAKRHLAIDSLYQADDHSAVVAAVDAQIAEATGTTWEDSLPTYVHRYAYCVWRSKNADAGAVAAEDLVALVKQRQGEPRALLTAYDGLSAYYYDVGRIKECIRVDSTALAFALRNGARIPPTKLGKAYHFLAFDHAIAGDHVKASDLELKAVKAYEQEDPLPHLLVAESWMGAGTGYWHSGRIQDAERAFTKALTYVESGTDHPSLLLKASIYGNRGILWQAAGDVARSRESYLNSIAIQSAIANAGEDPQLREKALLNRSKGYVNLATVYFGIGDLARASDLLDIAWRDRSSILEPGDPQLERLRERRADVAQARGDHQQAADHLRIYLRAMKESHGERSTYYVEACWRLAVEEEALGRSQRADSLFNVAIKICTEMGVEHTGTELGVLLQERAHIRKAQQRLPEALADIERAVRLVRPIYGPQSRIPAKMTLDAAEVHFEMGDMQRASALGDSVLAGLGQRIQELKTGKAPRPDMAPHLLSDALYTRVRAQRAAGMKGREVQWREDIDLAITSLRRSKAVLTDADSRLRLIGAQERLFNLAIDLAHEDLQRAPGVKSVQRLLDLSEAARSTLLKARLDEFSGLRFSGVPERVVAREEQLISEFSAAVEDPEKAIDLPRREAAYADFLDTLAREHPRYHALRYGELPVSLTEVRTRLLTDDRHLLVYVETSEVLLAIVVRKDTAVVIALDRKNLADEVKVLNGSIAARDAGVYRRAAYALYTRVLQPVRPWLTSNELLIVPDGPLHTVNFEVLLEKPSSANDFRDHLLLKRYAIAQLLSVTTAVQFARLDAPRSHDVLALAPGFTDELKQRYVAAVKDSTLLDRTYLHLVRQPFAVRAAQELGRTLSADVLLGEQATEQGFREQAMHHGVLHLGTHAEVDPTAPMYSRLVLSKGDDTTGLDGYLHAYEIYELDLRAQLAVLTACETGAGSNSDGEGVRSLGYSFAYAGCPSLVTSLWAIDEKVSSEIITRFYEYLADGMPKHLALRQAKLDHLATATDELAQPYYWGGMVLVGDVEPLEVGSWTLYKWWMLGGGVLMIVGVALLRRIRRKADGHAS